MAYLLDANVFIQAQKLHYGLDFCPAFWEWLDVQSQDGRVLSIDKVLDEIEAGDDDLVPWARARRTPLFPPLGAEVLDALPTVARWVQGRQYTEAAVNTFFQAADYFLIGRAMAHGDVLVTQEISRPDRRNKVMIPDVCIGVGVRFMSPFTMLRVEQARFVLGS